MQKTLAKICAKLNYTSIIEQLSELNKLSSEIVILLAILILNTPNNMNDINVLNSEIKHILKQIIESIDTRTEDPNLIFKLDNYKTELKILGQTYDISKINNLINDLNTNINISLNKPYNDHIFNIDITKRYELLKILNESKCVDILQSYQIKKHIISYINEFIELEDQYIENILLMADFLKTITNPINISSDLDSYYLNLKTNILNFIYINKNNGLQMNQLNQSFDGYTLNNIFILKINPSNDLGNIEIPTDDSNLIIDILDVKNFYNKLKTHDILPNGYIGSTTFGINNQKNHVNFVLLSESEIDKNDLKLNIDDVKNLINDYDEKINKKVNIDYDLSILKNNLEYISKSDVDKIFSQSDDIIKYILGTDMIGNLVVDYSNDTDNIIHELLIDYLYDYFKTNYNNATQLEYIPNIFNDQSNLEIPNILN